MIDFDIDKLSVEIAYLKTVSQAASASSISVLDHSKMTSAKEVTKRIAVSVPIARTFVLKMKKLTKFLKPVLVAITWYDGIVVALEPHPLGGFGVLESVGVDGTVKRWAPASQYNIDQFLRTKVSVGGYTWLFDGRYVYTFPGGVDEGTAVRGGKKLSSDGKFRSIVVQCIDLHNLCDVESHAELVQRTAVAFVSDTGQYTVSPPIWKDVESIGMAQKKREIRDGQATLVTDDQAMTSTFDRFDQYKNVNLNFALSAGRAVGKMFGYQFVEPLQLPRLMVELHTVNLPNVSSDTKATYDIGMKFSHAMAWLLGLNSQITTLSDVIDMRAQIKYLTNRGVFDANRFDPSRVFQPGKQTSDAPLLSLDDLMKQDIAKLSLSSVMQQVRVGVRGRAATSKITDDEE